MSKGEVVVLVLDLLGTFVFALNGALTAIRRVRLDIVGVLVLGIATAIGGGVIRDILIGHTPPNALQHWYYLAVAAAGSLIAFFWSTPHRRMLKTVLLLDAAGLSLFCVVGAQKALLAGLDPAPAIVLGAITAVGGGTLRDMMTGHVPTVLTSGLYAIPALIGAAITVTVPPTGPLALPIAILAAAVCFVIRLIGVRYRLNAPLARAHRHDEPGD